ncbi:mRNA-capping enzyme [Leptinotarsa decemlineata]|uniref:mRNA-capping enzyme n=1 Tax=Leptinotarsa decemlineata TaxID=7539 RepID=UPI003D3052D6
MGGSKNKLPEGWLDCPQNGNYLVAGKFMPLKTPLDGKFNNKLPSGANYSPTELFTRAKRNKVKIGLWVDLTNTYRYYNKTEIEQEQCQYVKLSCVGHGECPSVEITKKFIDVTHNFFINYPAQCIAVHCTHGFNRTGFLIVSFLVEKLKFDVGKAVEAFAHARPPGIYRGTYIRELFRRYGNLSNAPLAPPLPRWCSEKNKTRKYGKYR